MDYPKMPKGHGGIAQTKFAPKQQITTMGIRPRGQLPGKGQRNGAQKTKRNISAGRPPLARKPQPSLSAEMTRNLIRKHHQLNKELSKAEVQGQRAEVDELKKRIADLGGLESYQAASILGQSTDRGGDSSMVLMDWLKPVVAEMKEHEPKLRLLEVGALSTSNACSKSELFQIERIDLSSQAEGIIQQDFMERPLPAQNDEQFNIISLSLVLNFVPGPIGRGEMLKRTCQFLDPQPLSSFSERVQGIFPALFLVLPAPCITNSRYLSEERLTCIMATLGYVMLERKLTAKLVYYLWQLRDKPLPEEQDFRKRDINPGRSKNNFSIVL